MEAGVSISRGVENTYFDDDEGDQECEIITPYNITGRFQNSCVDVRTTNLQTAMAFSTEHPGPRDLEEPLSILVSTQSSEVQSFKMWRSSLPLREGGQVPLCLRPDNQTLLSGQISTLKCHFAAIHRVEPNQINSWTHGVASYPGVFVICVTLQIRTQVTYKTINEQRAFLLFSNVEADSPPIRFPWQDAPLVDVSRAHRIVYKHLKTWKNSDASRISLQTLYNAFVVALCVNDDQTNHRLSIAEEILVFLQNVCGIDGPFGIIDAFAAEIDLVRRVKALTLCSESEKFSVVTAFLRVRLPELLQDQDLKLFVDPCPVCAQPLTFGPHMTAECLDRHPFGPRCGATFLPIKDPGHTKHCSDCYHSFLNEDIDPDLSSDTCIPRRLLDAFDQCPLCNGKFFTRAGL